MSDYAGHLTTTVANGSQWLTCRVQYLDDTDPFSSTNFAEPARPPSYTFNVDLPLCEQLAGVHRLMKAPHKIDDCTLQISHTGAYLDLDISINEQKEELETFFADGKRNSIIIRTLLSVRVHSCIEKLYNSKGRELRRALFSLKQIFQDDKDLVHEFVNADGLTCLIKVGAEADQNYQNYILRALGQIMLYVDGMNGVIEHTETVRWLYTLIASRFRLVVKTTLKLLLVFVEYAEENALRLLDAVRHVDRKRRQKQWSNIMKVLDEKDGIDCELLVFAMTLVNKSLSNIPDQDAFYDITDALEALGMESISQRHLNKKGNDLDLVEQFKIYELALKHEDGDEEATNSPTPGAGIKWNRERIKSELNVERKSIRRHSSNSNHSQQLESTPEKLAPPTPEAASSKSTPSTPYVNDNPEPPQFNKRCRTRRDELSKQHLDMQSKKQQEGVDKLPASKSMPALTPLQTDPTISPRPWLVKKKPTVNGHANAVQYNSACTPDIKDREILRRRRQEDRGKRKTDFLNKQQEALNNRVETPAGLIQLQRGDASSPPPPPVRKSSSMVLDIERKRRTFQRKLAEDKKDSTEEAPEVFTNGDVKTAHQPIIKMEGDVIRIEDEVPPEMSRIATKTENLPFPADLKFYPVVQKPILGVHNSPSKQPGFVTPSGDVISADQKLMMDMLYGNQAVASKQTSESDDASSDISCDAPKENGVSKVECTTHSRSDVSQDTETSSVSAAKAAMEKMFSNKPIMTPVPLWQQSQNMAERTLTSEPALAPALKKDSDIMWEKLLQQNSKDSLVISEFDFSDLTEKDDIDIIMRHQGPKLVAPTYSGSDPPPPVPGMVPAPPPPPSMVPPPPPSCSPTPSGSPQNIKKQRTVRLFWKEIKHKDSKSLNKVSSIWETIDDVKFDEDKLLHLFELRTKDIVKKQQTDKKNRIVILDSKRSNAINIGLTALPPPRTIKSAILHMDEFALNKEQIEKLLTMIPTKDETVKIQDAMQTNPDIQLGSAEQFLLTLSSISELSARLNLWSFKLDYEVQEKEIAEPLIDLRDGMRQLKDNKTLKCVLAVLKSMGNILNNTKVKGFDIRYLSKVPEVKDTVHKQSLLHHLTQVVMENFPNTTDLYSDIGSVTRASKGDFTLIEEMLRNLETRCKESWDHLKTIAKHESKARQRNKMSDFLLSAAQRIITLGVIYKRLINRSHQTLVYFGMTPQEAICIPVQEFCRLISEFALEYRTAKDRAVTQQQKKQKRGERNKTRGKMITETRKFSQTEEQIRQKQMEVALSHGDGVETKIQRRQRSRATKVKDVASPVANGHTTIAEMESPPQTKSSVRRRTSRKVVDDHSDETIMDELVKAATHAPNESTVHRRKRSRNSSRKSLRRTLKNGLTDEEKAVIMGNF